MAVAANSEGLLAVTDRSSKGVHLLTKDVTLVRSIGGMVGGCLYGIAIDLGRNVWVTGYGNNKVVKLSQDTRRLLQTIYPTGSESGYFSHPCGVSVSAEGLVHYSSG